MPRNGHAVAADPVGERAHEILLDQRIDGGSGRADAGEDDALGGGDLVGAVDEARRETEAFQGVQHARCVPGAVVDDADHPRRRVANPVQ